MKILLTTLHSRYSHASLALPCIAAYCRDIPGADLIIDEQTVNDSNDRILKRIISFNADMIAFSCYIWNMEKTLRIAPDIKKIAPGALILLGGPEASFGVFELMHSNPALDYIIRGEGEQPLRRLLEALTCNDAAIPLERIDNLCYRDGDDIAAGFHGIRHIPLDTIPSPFEEGLVDLGKPLVYYETSRGCPFSCAFCLSSVGGEVRSFGMERIKRDLLFLMERKVKNIKLVDRTFNYDAKRAVEIWRFIMENNRESHFHFEVAADLLTDENLSVLKEVPENTFRFEIGIQSASEQTLAAVSRKTELAKAFEMVKRLRAETNVELHLDLVAGLPGEDYDGFLASLQVVADLAPHEIQVEPLKVLKGSPMREIAAREDYRFSGHPPYAILRTPWLSFEDICRIETIGRLLDLFWNHRGFDTAWRLIARTSTISAAMNRMARQAGDEPLSGLSSRRLYELFHRLALHAAPETGGGLIADALFYDYCRTEMPLMGRLPSFAVHRCGDCNWPGRKDLQDGLNLPGGSRIKMFRFTFAKDYRTEPWENGPAAITFVYVSGAGQGLRVLVV